MSLLTHKERADLEAGSLSRGAGGGFRTALADSHRTYHGISVVKEPLQAGVASVRVALAAVAGASWHRHWRRAG